jgi:hypothetical protein
MVGTGRLAICDVLLNPVEIVSLGKWFLWRSFSLWLSFPALHAPLERGVCPFVVTPNGVRCERRYSRQFSVSDVFFSLWQQAARTTMGSLSVYSSFLYDARNMMDGCNMVLFEVVVYNRYAFYSFSNWSGNRYFRAAFDFVCRLVWRL